MTTGDAHDLGTAADDDVEVPEAPDAYRVLLTVLDVAPVAACVTSADGTLEHVNAAYERLYGYLADELVGEHFTIVIPPEARAQARRSHDRFIARGGEIRPEWETVTKDRRRLQVLADACRVPTGDGGYRAVTFVVDPTETRTMRAQLAQADAEVAAVNLRLAHMSTHDSLTGLVSNRRCRELLVQAVEVAERYERGLAVVVIDLDHFAQVNTAFGHVEGDDALVTFAHLLEGQLRAVDTAGRIGGEEFLALLPETTAEGARVFLDRVRTACWDHLHTPDGRTVEFSAGAAHFRTHDTPDSLVRRAVEALEGAKQAGGNRTHVG